jgi:ubiquinone/menaquinone biosynthesis C-methylase UbiE
MPDFKTIYAAHAADYQRMVACEDHTGNLLPALANICTLEDAEVVEFGAGTGRLTVLLAPLARRITAIDISAHMLSVAIERLTAGGWDNWRSAVADNARMPVAAGSADLAIEGWSFGHLTGWYPDTWPQEVERVLAEMQRVLRPGGTAIILETLGTGNERPQPPAEALAAFYRLLEDSYDFTAEWIRTDYRFASPEAAADATRFFFGDALADWLIAEQRAILPECTGIWWRRW